MEIVDLQSGYTGPTFADLSQAAAGAGLTIPDNPAPDPSLLSMSYWQGKAQDFQRTLIALDAGYSAAQTALSSPDALAADPELQSDLSALMDEFQSKRTALRLTAEAINGGASIVNALGGDFQKLNIPSTLGIAPLAFPVAAVGAFAVAATLIAWGVTWLRGLNQRLARAQLLSADPTLAAAMQQSDDAAQQAESTGFSSIANLVKWGGIALAAWIAWRAFGKHLKVAGD
jgi:hypothetical protein